MGSSKGAILILTHSRAGMLEELLENVELLEGRINLPLIVVRQLGDESVGKVIATKRSKINMLIELDGSAPSVAQNISANRVAGYSAAFDTYKIDWVLAIEDDVLLARDTLTFISHVYEKYKKNRNFRGINLGSKLKVSELTRDSFCLIRFGIYGQGSVITEKTWQQLKKFNLIESALKTHWDSAFEFFIKTGFMVSPNNSRYIDRGINGTHMGSPDTDSYFSDVANSFVGFETNSNINYFKRDLGYWWRGDLKRYNFYENLFYWGKFLVFHPSTLRIVKHFTAFSSKYKR